MIDDWREIVRWAVLFLFVLIATFLVDWIVGPVLTWLSQLVFQAVSVAGTVQQAERTSWAFSYFSETIFHFAAGGFAYAWLVNVEWKRGAVMAAACLLILRYGTALVPALASPWFYTDAVVGGLAAAGGARYFEEWRYNDVFVDLRRRLHDRLQLA